MQKKEREKGGCTAHSLDALTPVELQTPMGTKKDLIYTNKRVENTPNIPYFMWQPAFLSLVDLLKHMMPLVKIVNMQMMGNIWNQCFKVPYIKVMFSRQAQCTTVYKYHYKSHKILFLSKAISQTSRPNLYKHFYISTKNIPSATVNSTEQELF